MTKNNYSVKHDTYSGEISVEDFNTYSPNKKRIINQHEADILTNKLKGKSQKMKNMSLEELKELRLISNTEGRPTDSMTDALWQKEFELRKCFIKPAVTKKMSGKFSKESGYWNDETMGTYHGSTNYQEYCSFINDILSEIRSNHRDYCYFMYQVLDLVKFEPELKTKYCDGYWEVWL